MLQKMASGALGPNLDHALLHVTGELKHQGLHVRGLVEVPRVVALEGVRVFLVIAVRVHARRLNPSHATLIPAKVIQISIDMYFSQI